LDARIQDSRSGGVTVLLFLFQPSPVFSKRRRIADVDVTPSDASTVPPEDVISSQWSTDTDEVIFFDIYAWSFVVTNAYRMHECEQF